MKPCWLCRFTFEGVNLVAVGQQPPSMRLPYPVCGNTTFRLGAQLFLARAAYIMWGTDDFLHKLEFLWTGEIQARQVSDFGALRA